MDKLSRRRISGVCAAVFALVLAALCTFPFAEAERERPPLQFSTRVVAPESWEKEKGTVPIDVAMAQWSAYQSAYRGGMRNYVELYSDHPRVEKSEQTKVCGGYEFLSGNKLGWDSAREQITVLEEFYTRDEIVDCLSRLRFEE